MTFIKNLALRILFSFLIFTFCSCQNTFKESNKYEYETIDSAPFDIKIHTLKNGLKIYMVPRKDEPKIQTRVVVKAGSTQDPDNARGLAHYLEHLLFAGTDKIGAFNFDKEAPLLTEIENLFEKHRKTLDDTEKTRIYNKIDSLSYEASKYSYKNEYRDLMKKMGISFMNAFTRSDVTGYMNSIPSNQLEKWLILEAERFRNPVFRGFHTELETVYEEMNRSLDNRYRQGIWKINEITIPEEYYKEPLGTVESLKNPSLLKTKEFFETYYVPNNMAIILAGDFNSDEAVRLIEENFGYMKPKELPKVKKAKSLVLESKKEAIISTPGKPSIGICFVHEPPNAENAYMFEFVEMMILNGNVDMANIGNIKSESQWFNSLVYKRKNFTAHILEAQPKDQSLKELEDTILNSIDRLKKGDFPDWMLDAIANDLNRRFYSSIDSNNGVTGLLIDSYAYDIPLESTFSKQEKYHDITKAEVMEYAQKYYQNYSVVYNESADKDSLLKVSKPQITGLSTINAGKTSIFGKKINEIETKDIEPEVVNFDKKIKKTVLVNGVTINSVKNKDNSLFSLDIVFDKGAEDKILKFSSEYIKLVGTDIYSVNEIKSELYKLGCKFSVDVDENKTTITVDGLIQNLEQSISLVKDLLFSPKLDEDTFKFVKASEISKINNYKNSRFHITNRFIDYVTYGLENTFQSVLTKEDINSMTKEKIVNKFAQLFNYHHEFYFYGNVDNSKLGEILYTHLEKSSSLQPLEKKSSRLLKSYTSNNVFLLDYKAKQLEIIFTAKTKKFNSELISMNYLFRDYFETIINDEIRESRGLAYNTTNRMVFPEYRDEHFSFHTKVGTQTDKYAEVLDLNYNLIRNMPIDESVFSKVKQRLTGQWVSQRIDKANLLNHYQETQNLGINTDYRRQYFEVFPKYELQDLKNFYDEWIKDNYYNLIIVGDLDEIDRNKLKKYGKITELSIEEIFGN